MSSFVAAAVTSVVGAGIVADVATGAILGGVVSGVTGGSVGQGMLMGGLGGAITSGLSSAMGSFSAAGSGATAAVDSATLQSGMDAYAKTLQANATAAGQTLSAADAAAQASQAYSSALGITPTDLTAAVTNGQGLAASGQGANTLAKGLNYAKTAGVVGQGALNFAGSQLQANAANEAAQTRADAAAKAGQQQLAIYNQQQAALAPWQAAGTTALDQLSAGTQAGGQFDKSFSTADMSNVMPAFTFAKDQGLQSMQNQLRAQGQTGSNVVQGAGTLAEGLASQYEGQAFNQFQADQNRKFNQLSGLAGTGQVATTQGNTNLGTLGANQGNLTLTGGGAIATGQAQSANATAGGLQGIGNSLAQLLSPPVGG